MTKKRRVIKRKKRKTLKGKVLRLFFFVGFIVAGSLSFGAFFPQFQLKQVTVSGNEKISNEEISAVVQKEVKKDFWFFKTESVILTDYSKIVKDILSEYPLIEKAEATMIFPSSVSIQIFERTAAMIFCKGNRCFLVDKSGIAFEEGSSAETSFVVRDNLEEEVDLAIGKKVIEESLVESLVEIYNFLRFETKVGIREALIQENGRITVKTLEGWEIYLTTKNDISWQLAKLKTVLVKEIPFEKRNLLEYIDLRFGNMAPYRYKTTGSGK